MITVPPRGFAEVVTMFGDPRPYLADGDDTDWQREILTTIEIPWALTLAWDPRVSVRKMRVHKRAAENFAAVFGDLAHQHFDRELTEFGGTYNARVQRGASERLSMHTWAIAIDLNPQSNRLGTHGNMPPDVVDVFERYGFRWGGDFYRPDPMHFELVART